MSFTQDETIIYDGILFRMMHIFDKRHKDKPIKVKKTLHFSIFIRYTKLLFNILYYTIFRNTKCGFLRILLLNSKILKGESDKCFGDIDYVYTNGVFKSYVNIILYTVYFVNSLYTT